jgi:AcrR family transcriptional regulator
MEVRDRILKEAAREFFQFGIRNVTMDEIAHKLGISKRTIYETFKDKTELLITCLESYSEELKQKKEEIISNSSNVLESIFTFLKNGISTMNAINPVFINDLKKFYPEVWQNIYLNNEIKNLNLTHKLLRKGVNEGIFLKELNLDIISKLIMEQVKVLADENAFPRDKYSVSEVFQSMVISFTRGISTQKGLELIDKMVT